MTLAVLPFENLSGDPEADYLASGLAEEVTVALGLIDPGHVHIVGRTSFITYQHTTKSREEIGRELNADYLVESAVRAEGGRVRITASLVRMRDQVQVWSDSYDRQPISILSLQQELSRAIATQIRLRLSPDRLNAFARRQTQNAEAYDLYLRGRNFANQRTPATTTRAIEYFQRATDLDPNYALAWAGLARVYSSSMLNADAAADHCGPSRQRGGHAGGPCRSRPERGAGGTRTLAVDVQLGLARGGTSVSAGCGARSAIGDGPHDSRPRALADGPRIGDTSRRMRSRSCTPAWATQPLCSLRSTRRLRCTTSISSICPSIPKWDPYRDDPRFKALINQCGFLRTASH